MDVVVQIFITEVWSKNITETFLANVSMRWGSKKKRRRNNKSYQIMRNDSLR